MTADVIQIEKRTDPRYTARIAIFNGPYQKKILTNYSINISSGGLFIETSKILPVATDLVIKFNLPDLDIIIVTRARVAWTNEPGSFKKASLPSGMGLQFLDLSLEDLHCLRSYFENNRLVPTW